MVMKGVEAQVKRCRSEGMRSTEEKVGEVKVKGWVVLKEKDETV